MSVANRRTLVRDFVWMLNKLIDGRDGHKGRRPGPAASRGDPRRSAAVDRPVSTDARRSGCPHAAYRQR
ncbi:hypothetical protein Jiend_54760 [Micromonospora endophytica]|nr:hypothetical protein Jiend_54760 [Micromonospora endophytica]